MSNAHNNPELHTKLVNLIINTVVHIITARIHDGGSGSAQEARLEDAFMQGIDYLIAESPELFLDFNNEHRCYLYAHIMKEVTARTLSLSPGKCAYPWVNSNWVQELVLLLDEAVCRTTARIQKDIKEREAKEQAAEQAAWEQAVLEQAALEQEEFTDADIHDMACAALEMTTRKHAPLDLEEVKDLLYIANLPEEDRERIGEHLVRVMGVKINPALHEVLSGYAVQKEDVPAEQPPKPCEQVRYAIHCDGRYEDWEAFFNTLSPCTCRRSIVEQECEAAVEEAADKLHKKDFAAAWNAAYQDSMQKTALREKVCEHTEDSPTPITGLACERNSAICANTDKRDARDPAVLKKAIVKVFRFAATKGQTPSLGTKGVKQDELPGFDLLF